jgi:hypothetical protein
MVDSQLVQTAVAVKAGVVETAPVQGNTGGLNIDEVNLFFAFDPNHIEIVDP